MAASRLPHDDAREARTFLRAVFGRKPDDLYVVVWELAGKRSRSFDDLDAAAEFCAGRQDVYVHVGLTRRGVAGPQRLKAADVDAIPGVWADLDVAHAAHKKTDLPPDEPTARALARGTGLEPALVVRSGHGLQAWWLFPEPWAFDTEEERARAAVLCRAWDISLRARAKQAGYTLDAVGDLARLLRVPGTLNAKDPRAVVPVRLLTRTALAVSEDQVEAALLDGTWEQAERELSGRGSTTEISYGGLVLDPDAEPPWEKWDALRDLEPRFDEAWRRKASKRAERWSSSEWDMSLASYAAQAGWTAQEIANLIIASRRKHRDDLKLRQDYYGPTINKALREKETRVDTALALEQIEAATNGEEAPDGEGLRAKLSGLLGVQIRRFVQYRAGQPRYRLETDDDSIIIGDSAAVLSQNRFRAQVFAVTRKVIPAFKPKEWEPIARALGELCEQEDIGEEATEYGQARTWIASYLAAHPALDDATEAAKRGTAFIRDGATYVYGHELRKWLVVSEFDRITAQEMGSVLKVYGCSPIRVHVKLRDRWTTKSAWKIPPESPGEESARITSDGHIGAQRSKNEN